MKITELQKQYDKNVLHQMLLILAALGALFIVVLISLRLGIADISFRQIIDLIIKMVFRRGIESINVNQKIVLLLRFPRVILGILAGAALSVSGVVMQGLTRNPLVSPFTIGISSAAAFGASIAIVFNIVIFPGSVGGVIFNAFFFSILCAALVFGVSWKLGMSPETMILIGIALNYLFGALTSVIQFVAEEHQLAAAVQWVFGSLNGATWEHNLYLALIFLICLPILLRFSLSFNAMTVGGDDFAKTLGINTTIVKIIAGSIAVLLTASTISFTGVIGFIGLVSPHIGRLLIGGDHRRLIPFSMLIGSILIVTSDTIGRILISPVVIPVGIVISFIGVPLFLNLIITRRTRYFG